MSKGNYITRSQVINVYCGHEVGLDRNKLAEINNLSLISVDRILKIMITARDKGPEVMSVLGENRYLTMKKFACDYFGVYVQKEPKNSPIMFEDAQIKEIESALTAAYESFKALEEKLNVIADMLEAAKTKSSI